MKRKAVIGIGSYDGVHKGHQRIITDIVRISKKRKIVSSIFFFNVPPKLYIRGEVKNNLITLPDERNYLIRKYGIEEVISLDFDETIHTMKPEDFFERYIMSYFDIDCIVVGKDFAVGYNRVGNIEWLREFANKNGFEVHICDFVTYKGHKISSSLIRDYIKKGYCWDVYNMLSRWYSISGVVIRGAGIGRTLGFPTANIDVDDKKILPHGVFVVCVAVENEKFFGVANVGKRPTLKKLNSNILCEVHIIDFDREIYDKNIRVEFLKKIRDEKRFDNLDKLKEQIGRDVNFAKNFVQNHLQFCKI